MRGRQPGVGGKRGKEWAKKLIQFSMELANAPFDVVAIYFWPIQVTVYVQPG
jgi:hypothetical protein